MCASCTWACCNIPSDSAFELHKPPPNDSFSNSFIRLRFSAELFIFIWISFSSSSLLFVIEYSVFSAFGISAETGVVLPELPVSGESSPAFVDSLIAVKFSFLIR
jgi:hypothetical protein